MTGQPTTIGIAVVEHRGRYLVGRRSAGTVLAGKAEFPGGKCEPDETPADAAVRECREETGLEVVAERRLLERTFEYAHGTVELHFWLCRPASSIVAEDCNGYRWLSVEELRAEDFPAANAPLLELIRAESPWF